MSNPAYHAGSRLSDSDDTADNDMDYEPSETVTQESRESTSALESTTEDEDDEEEEGEPEYFDSVQALLGQALAQYEEETGEEGQEDEEGDEEQGGIVELIMEEGDDDLWDGEDSDEEEQQVFTIVGNTFRVRLPHSRRRHRGPRDLSLENLEPVPSDQGRELMSNGDFGYYEIAQQSPRKRRRSSGASTRSPTTPKSPQAARSPESAASPTSPRSPGTPRPLSRHQMVTSEILESSCKRQRMLLGRRLLLREMGVYTGEPAKMIDSLVAQSLIPTSTEKVLHFDARCYSGQFSEDGNFFYCCSQDMVVRMYDTSNPYDWKYYRSAEYPGGHWTITDASLSPDNRQLAYSSLDSSVYMARTQSNDDDDDLTLLDFSDGPRQYAMRNGTPIWSIRFSGDGKELVAGAKDDSLYVYDIEMQRSILKLTGHTNDVNAVCYGDKSSPHIIFSGSDDSTIKIWDRRSMASGREAGAFLGHMEGLTYIDSKGDGRYVLSNAKDQTMKLWDIRKLTDRSTYERSGITNHASGFDYRFENYDYHPIRKHPNDNSVVTFRGHRVLKTLIRCHFSPPTSSGSRYVYTGSEDGRVFIYNLDATIAGVIDVQSSTFDRRPQPSYNWRGFGFSRGRPAWETVTRDVSWHPDAPMIVSTSWDGYGQSQGSVAIHGWDGKIRGEGMTRDDFGYWNRKRRGLRDNCDGDDKRSGSPVRTDEQLRPRRPYRNTSMSGWDA
ncbi:hypothetical protein H072_9569 [Dactylellina haptotyla CBS 200.50]|uniref:Uncharacterized protein n=1 Tax=Dactylellina haptotyla (strain CBS 200.50) TaxID=1284197 RepID=S8BC74_DACHA|nr:hypothetical protein H072_9569 [Dactylellina haptotyla CBS 200.50]